MFIYILIVITLKMLEAFLDEEERKNFLWKFCVVTGLKHVSFYLVTITFGFFTVFPLNLNPFFAVFSIIPFFIPLESV